MQLCLAFVLQEGILLVGADLLLCDHQVDGLELVLQVGYLELELVGNRVLPEKLPHFTQVLLLAVDAACDLVEEVVEVVGGSGLGAVGRLPELQ